MLFLLETLSNRTSLVFAFAIQTIPKPRKKNILFLTLNSKVSDKNMHYKKNLDLLSNVSILWINFISFLFGFHVKNF